MNNDYYDNGYKIIFQIYRYLNSTFWKGFRRKLTTFDVLRITKENSVETVSNTLER